MTYMNFHENPDPSNKRKDEQETKNKDAFNKRPPKMDGGPSGERPGKGSWIFVVLLIFFSVYLITSVDNQSSTTVPYSEFKSLIQKGEVAEVTFQGNEIVGKFKEPQKREVRGKELTVQTFSTFRPEVEDSGLMSILEQNKVLVSAKDRNGSWPLVLFLNLLPWILIIGFFYYSSKRLRENMGGIGQGLPFQRSRAKRFVKTTSSNTFSDVAGLENAKAELVEIIDYLKKPDKYQKMGAKLPKGILLVGPPGTGKTLLARATAGEANVPFFSISGSEFIEVFVGVGASRVRDLFETAKKSAPAIIFIDEIDSIGRARGTGLGGGHDEREQTLNQILSEMDGFESERPIVVMAATNRPDVLDPALVRPGRFDRQITLDLPHKDARKQILKLHLKKVPQAKDLDLENLARSTVGFSGADLRNLVNEASFQAAREDKDVVTQFHFDLARDKIILGHKREEFFSDKEKRLIAFHEAGHTTVAHLLPNTDPVRKVTIIPRGRALGATEQLPDEERHSIPQGYLEDQIAVLLGGRVSEKMIFNEVTTGAEDDLKRATRLARKMVMNWGMSPRLGYVSFKQGEEHHFLGKEIIQDRDFSERTAQIIDEEVNRILREKQEMVEKLLKENRSKLELIATHLLEKETLEARDIKELLQA